MSNYNLVILMGRITRDVETKYTQRGTAVARIGIAVNRVWKSEAGEKKEEVTFIDAEAWGKTAENIAQYFRKGDPIHITGRIKVDSWEDKQSGQKRTKTLVAVEQFQFIGGRKNESPAPAPPTRSKIDPEDVPTGKPPEAAPEAAPEGDDVPF